MIKRYLNSVTTTMRTISGIRFFILLVFAACFLPGSVKAQSITISEELALRNDYAYTILGWVDKNLLLFRDKGHAFFIQAFDEEMHLKWERELYLGDSRADIIGIVAHSDRFHIIYGTREKGSYAILHKSFSKEVTLVDTSTVTRFENVFMIPRFLMRESEDKSKVLLYKQENKSLQLYSYDLHTLQIIWAKSINFEGTQLEEDFRPLIVNNYGDFYLPMRSERTQLKVQFLHVLSSAPNVVQVIHDTIRLGDIQILDIFPVYDHIQQCLVVTGLCGERNTSRAKGFYFVRYHDDQRAEMSLLQFDESLLTEVNGRGVAVSKGLSDFTVQRVALRQDGGAVIIAELIKEFSRRSSLPMQRDNGAYAREGWVDYYFEDMILFAVHPDGTEHWKEVLRKRQYSQDDGAMYSSFMLFKTPEHLRFLFNDEIKQENTVGGYEVAGNGYVERKTVFNTDYQRLKLRFRDGVQLSNNECIVPSERGSKLNLVRIEFK